MNYSAYPQYQNKRVVSSSPARVSLSGEAALIRPAPPPPRQLNHLSIPCEWEREMNIISSIKINGIMHIPTNLVDYSSL